MNFLIKNSRIVKLVCWSLIFSICTQIFFCTPAFALTGGPSQPEVQSFEPVGTSEMVDLFSGDFTYNIPLIDVGGYPVNLSYSAGITMDQEASWVGLGWNINPGVVNRSVRGLPDDFSGDAIKKSTNKKDMHNIGVTGSVNGEVFGIKFLKLGASLGITYNNYRGIGMELGLSPSISAGDKAKGLNLGLGISASSQSGVGLTPTVSLEKETKDSEMNSKSITGKIGLPFNSREGFKAVTLGLSVERVKMNKITDDKGNVKTYQGVQLKGKNGGSSISFANTTFVPQLNMSLINESVAFSATFGAEIFGTHPMFNIIGYYSGQQVTPKDKSAKAYGYLYAQNAHSNRDALLDFNREKDMPYTENLPNLPVTNYTYDVYSVSGQGVGGMYRPFRSDVGIVYDTRMVNYSVDLGTLGVELGAGNGAHGGMDYAGSHVKTESGQWSGGNGISSLRFNSASNSNPLYEPAYFKQLGEKPAEVERDFFTNWRGFDAAKIQIIGDHAIQALETESAGSSPINRSKIQRNTRQRRNQNISYLNAAEASNFGLNTSIEIYDRDTFKLDPSLGAYEILQSGSRTNYGLHHISEVTTLRPDGGTYVYGIPAYNKHQEEVTFNVDETNADCTTGLVSYTPGVDNSKENRKGLDWYYDRTETPAFAHSYLLTAVLSSDYIDSDGIRGPSNNDLGSYTKLNYSKISDYNWRVPSPNETGLANHNEGLKTNIGKNGDDKGSYIFGTKEIWYLHSLETKTHLAEFYLSDREDALGVTDANGGINRGVALQKLDSIKLYTKADKLNELNTGKKATPIKVVHLAYDYSLFDGGALPNSKNFGGAVAESRGKLTLKEVYFTYGNSYKGKLSSYRFNYSRNNPEYDIKGYDRWGYYKPNIASCNNENIPTTAEFPYVEQNKAQADIYASCWNLTSIELPSGGVINVTYESDDYAYVQDRWAMQMIKVTGTDRAPNFSPHPVNTNKLMEDKDSYPILYFELPSGIPITASNPRNELYKKYLKGINNLYFKFLVDIGKSGNEKEFVSGYTQIADFGLSLKSATSTEYKHGWIKLNEPGVQNDGGGARVNPISKAAWNYAQLYNPRIAYDQDDRNTENIGVDLFKSLVGALDSVMEFFRGFHRTMRDRGHGKHFNKNKSWIRLNNPDGHKLGGGHRVSKVTISDQWKNLTGNAKEQNFEYGQEYNYEITEEINGEMQTISSGVAAYEPLAGGDENPFRQPVKYSDPKKFLIPHQDHFVEEPFGESFFPGPSVGYRQVTVKNLQYTNVTQHATGSLVHEFYTAKEFPVKAKHTGMTPNRTKPEMIAKILKIRNKDYFTGSQGYVVELNDMHGKPKGQKVYSEDSKIPISGVSYFYKTSSPKNLDNNVSAVSKHATNNIVRNEMIGVDFDVIVDMRESKTTVHSGGVRGNLDAFLAAILPIAIPIALPAISKEETRFRSVVMTKVINRYGLLERTEAFDLGSRIATKNLLYDAETGEVLLTETQNNFDDPVYSFTYPAHWSYDRMGPAYKNVGVTFNGLSLNIENPSRFFVIGDIVALQSSAFTGFGWVASMDNEGVNLIDSDGNPIDRSIFFNKIKVIKSGRKNQQSTPVGNVVSLTNPLVDSDNDGSYDRIDFRKVIDANAVVFSEDWRMFCNCDFNPEQRYNPFLKGLKGNFRAKRSYLYLTERTQSHLNDNTDIRRDGVFKTFNPFWLQPSSYIDWEKDTTNWTWSADVTEFSPYGFELENKDPLNRYSAAVYGYNNTLPISVANNSRYKEVGFDNFEDYDFSDCIDDHFSYKEHKSKLSKSKSHSGKYSLKIPGLDSAKVTKVINTCD